MRMSAAIAGLHPSILREYDIRGIVGETLTEDGMRNIGRAFGTIVRRQGGSRIAVGYDGRLSSPMLEAALVAGLIETGAAVSRVGLGPSPMLYYATHHLQSDAGMMVTGSHNPADYNGIKMLLQGRPFFGPDIQALGDLVRRQDFERGSGQAEERPVAAEYVARLVAAMEPGRALRVAWDPGNGAACDVLKLLCARLPGTHTLVNAEVDGTFPAHHPDPTVESNLEQLKSAVREHGCDAGIAFDGDGDRIGVVDSAGRVIWGDQLLVILAKAVLDELPGATILADVKSSQLFFDEIERMGGKPLMSKTGHSLIKNMMTETGASLAGEMSGHSVVAHRYYGVDDALYAAVRLLSILARSSATLAEMRDAMPTFVNTPELRIDCAEQRKFEVVAEVRRRLKTIPGLNVHDLDGVRVSTPDGWWLLRASNTQPVLVGRCEAKTAEGLSRLLGELARQLRMSEVDPEALQPYLA